MEVRNGPQQFSELEGCRVAGTEIVMVELQPGYIARLHPIIGENPMKNPSDCTSSRSLFGKKSFP
jgi:hypothetical protein